MVETGGLEKIKRPDRYLVEKATKTLCQLQDSDNFCFIDLLCFCLSCAGYSYNSATVGLLPDLADMTVARSWDRAQFWTSIIEEHLVHSEGPRVYNRLLAVKTEIPALYNLGSVKGD